MTTKRCVQCGAKINNLNPLNERCQVCIDYQNSLEKEKNKKKKRNQEKFLLDLKLRKEREETNTEKTSKNKKDSKIFDETKKYSNEEFDEMEFDENYKDFLSEEDFEDIKSKKKRK